MQILKRLFRRRAAPTREAKWSIVRAMNEATSEAAVIRIRIDRPAGSFALRTAVEISWPFISQSHFPPSEVHERMVEFEEAIDELTSENGHTELVQVSTGHGVKEWLFYSQDRARFMDRMNELLHGHSMFPLEIKFYEDPEWQIWSETASALDARTGG